MNYKSQINQQIIEAVSSKNQLQEDEVRELVSKSVDVEVDYPFTLVTKNSTTKPTNIRVELNVLTAFELVSQAGLFSNDPMAQAGAVAGLCSIVGRRLKVDIEPEISFVYWIAFENRHDCWEIPKEELIELAVQESQEVQRPLDIDSESVEYYINELSRLNCVKFTDGGETVILRELCSADWSK